MQETIYDRLAAADNISLKSGNSSSSSSQAFSIQALTGDYRRIVHKPQDLLWKILEYADPDQPLALSELERLAGAQEPSALQGMCHQNRQREDWKERFLSTGHCSTCLTCTVCCSTCLLVLCKVCDRQHG